MSFNETVSPGVRANHTIYFIHKKIKKDRVSRYSSKLGSHNYTDIRVYRKQTYRTYYYGMSCHPCRTEKRRKKEE